MNGATYRTLREALGFSVATAALFHEVSPRTIKYWDAAGDDGIPPGAAKELQGLDARMDRAAQLMCDHYRDIDFPNPFYISRYNNIVSYDASPMGEIAPFSAQGTLIDRMRRALTRAGATVIIEYGD